MMRSTSESQSQTGEQILLLPIQPSPYYDPRGSTNRRFDQEIPDPGSVNVECPNCNNVRIWTSVERSSGLGAWLGCVGCCAIGCVFGCCLLPFCSDLTKISVHSCPNCHAVLRKDFGRAAIKQSPEILQALTCPK